MRSEEIISKALEQVDNDRYKLSALVFARIKELGNGAQSLVDIKDIAIKELSDIALLEIAMGKIKLDRIEDE